MATAIFHRTSRPFDPGPFQHGPIARLRALFTLWSDRAHDRAQLAKWDDRDLHDAGISRSMLEYEINKPFWRG